MEKIAIFDQYGKNSEEPSDFSLNLADKEESPNFPLKGGKRRDYWGLFHEFTLAKIRPMFRLWRKVRKNFDQYEAYLKSSPLPEVVRTSFDSKEGQLDLFITSRDSYPDLLCACLGLQVFRDIEFFLKMGMSREESEYMAWKYMERYQETSLIELHYFLPVRARYFREKLSEKLHKFHPHMHLPIPGRYVHTLSLMEHSQNTQMIAQTEEVFAYFQYADPQ